MHILTIYWDWCKYWSELYIGHKVQIKISSLRVRSSERKAPTQVHALTWTWAFFQAHTNIWADLQTQAQLWRAIQLWIKSPFKECFKRSRLGLLGYPWKGLRIKIAKHNKRQEGQIFKKKQLKILGKYSDDSNEQPMALIGNITLIPPSASSKNDTTLWF